MKKLLKMFSWSIWGMATVMLLSACGVNSTAKMPKGPWVRNIIFSPDNKHLIFDAIFRNHRFELGLYNIETEKLQPFILDPNFSWSDPAFSPNGQYIAVTKASDGQSNSSEIGSWIVLLDLQAKERKIRRLHTGKIFQYAPSFSPDGKWLAYFEAPMAIDKTGAPFPVTDKGLTINRTYIETGQTEKIYYTSRKGFGGRLQYWGNNQVWAYVSFFDTENTMSELICLDLSGNKVLSAWLTSFEDTKARVLVSKNETYLIKSSSTDDVYNWTISRPRNGSGLFVRRKGQYKSLLRPGHYFSSYQISQDGKKALIFQTGDEAGFWIIDTETGDKKKTVLYEKLIRELEAFKHNRQ